MVLDHLIGLEHIRPDLAPPGDVLLLSHDRLELRVFLLALELVDPGFQDLHRARSVLELRPFVLTLHDDAARNVRDTHGSFHLVDVLASGTAGPERVDPELLVLDGHLAVVFQLRVDEHGCEGRMAALVGVEGGDPHEPVYTRLRL